MPSLSEWLIMLTVERSANMDWTVTVKREGCAALGLDLEFSTHFLNVVVVVIIYNIRVFWIIQVMCAHDKIFWAFWKYIKTKISLLPHNKSSQFVYVHVLTFHEFPPFRHTCMFACPVFWSTSLSSLSDSVKPHITGFQTAVIRREWEGEGALLINATIYFI